MRISNEKYWLENVDGRIMIAKEVEGEAVYLQDVTASAISTVYESTLNDLLKGLMAEGKIERSEISNDLNIRGEKFKFRMIFEKKEESD